MEILILVGVLVIGIISYLIFSTKNGNKQEIYPVTPPTPEEAEKVHRDILDKQFLGMSEEEKAELLKYK